ncbi:hypothetical protein Sste5346_001667 [Sporothrix stenoceras]|uniref:Uncharacterized protein n=1 Tax=Sporothrix stenoceras TaxID=5173 RepID=A0ABR3ZPD4_9PEZI
MRSIRSRLFGEISLTTAIVAALGFSATTRAVTSHSATFGASPAATTAAGGSGSDTGFSGGGFGSGSGSGSDSTNTVIIYNATDFNDGNIDYPTDSVIILGPDTAASKSFGFTVSSTTVNVTGVNLRNTLSESAISTASLDPATGQGSSDTTASVPITLRVQPAGETQTGTVTIENYGPIFDNGLDGKALFFEITWTTKDGVTTGSSYSRTFTYINNSVQTATVLSLFTNTYPVSAETSRGGSHTTGSIQTPATTTSNPTATNADGSITGPTRSGSSNSSSGLSKGAIAGIVVGAIAAIAIIAILAFFFLRRRRQSRIAANQAYNSALLSGSVEPYRGGGPVPDLGGPQPGMHPNLHDGTGSGTAVNLMEKDAVVAGVASRFAGRDVGPDTPNSLHSPYTDEDGGTPQIIPSRAVPTSSAGVSTAASPTARTAQTVTPVVSPVAVPAQPVAPGSSAGASTGTAAAAQPAIRNEVAALIEDHMTPEDVARLEAEERELDADIENAIRNRAAASSR